MNTLSKKPILLWIIQAIFLLLSLTIVYRQISILMISTLSLDQLLFLILRLTLACVMMIAIIGIQKRRIWARYLTIGILLIFAVVSFFIPHTNSPYHIQYNENQEAGVAAGRYFFYLLLISLPLLLIYSKKIKSYFNIKKSI